MIDEDINEINRIYLYTVIIIIHNNSIEISSQISGTRRGTR